MSKDAIARKAQKQGWDKDRDKVRDIGATKSIQKAANAVASNATLAQDIKRKLLQRLNDEIDALPAHIGTEMFQNVQNMEYDAKGKRLSKRTDGGKTYKLRDLTAAFADLTKDMVFEQERSNGLLQSLLELERRGESHDL